MKVLIATDGSAEATTAMNAACGLLKKDEREVHVLCVAPQFSRPGAAHRSGGLYERYRRRILPETQQILERAHQDLCAEGVSALTLTEIGSPARVITALTADYDLTVIGPKGRRERSAVGLGPVASRVVEHGKGAVLIGRDLKANDSGVRVLLALDGSEASFEALDTLAAMFDLDAAEVTLMHVMETPWVHLGFEEDWLGNPEKPDEQSEPDTQFEPNFQLEANELLREGAKRLRPFDATVTMLVEQGNPANEILSEADRGEYDLIVLGRTGARDLKHEMLGSVSMKVAWQANCSVLLVSDAPVALA